jgi:transposase
MSYDRKYRERAVSYRLEGNTIEKTSKVFAIGTTTLKKWLKQYKETGDLSKKPLKRKARKLEAEVLVAYIESNPDSYQYEIAEHFGCDQSSVCKALKRLGITHKKRQ